MSHLQPCFMISCAPPLLTRYASQSRLIVTTDPANGVLSTRRSTRQGSSHAHSTQTPTDWQSVATVALQQQNKAVQGSPRLEPLSYRVTGHQKRLWRRRMRCMFGASAQHRQQYRQDSDDCPARVTAEFFDTTPSGCRQAEHKMHQCLPVPCRQS